MGTRRKRNADPFRWSEDEVLKTLDAAFLKSAPIRWNHIHLFHWESDRVCRTEAGIWHEIEVKISLADYKRDFTDKREKHAILSGEIDKYLKPNHFWYAVPETLILDIKPLLPSYAGLISIPRFGAYVRIETPAPTLHKNKLSDTELDLMRKFYFLASEYKQKYQGFSEEKNSLKAEIDFIKSEFEAVTGTSWKEHLKDIG